MSSEAPAGPYVYQPYGPASHSERVERGDFYAVAGLPGGRQIRDLTRAQTGDVLAAISTRQPRGGTMNRRTIRILELAAIVAIGVGFLVGVTAENVDGQVIRDSVSITVIDRNDVGLTITPSTVRAGVGDTLTFEAFATDSITGERLPTFVLWTSTDTTVIRIEPNGFATFLARGSAQLIVDAEVIWGLALTAVITRVDGTVETIDLGSAMYQPAEPAHPALPTLFASLGVLALVRRVGRSR